MDKTIRMPKELLAKWLAALRSGEYEQGTGALCRDGRYCCLGVLMRIAGEKRSGGLYPPTHWAGSQGITFFDSDGCEWPTQPYLPALKLDAGDANDTGKTFAEIADAIEACAEGYDP